MILAALLLLAPPQPITLVSRGELRVTGGEAQGIDFDPAGRRMLTYGWFGDVVLWDLESLKVRGGVVFEGGDVLTVALHPTMDVAVVMLAQRGFEAPEDLRLVDLATGRVLDRMTSVGVSQFAWNAEGDTLALRGATPSIVEVPPNALGFRAPRPGVVKDGFAARWSRWRGVAEEYRGCASLPGSPERLSTTGILRLVAHTPDGATAVVADTTGQLHVCREDGVRVVEGHFGVVNGLAFAPDGKHLAARGPGAVTFASVDGAIVGRRSGSAAVCAGPGGADVWLTGRGEALRVDAATGRIVERRVPPEGAQIDIGRGLWSMEHAGLLREQVGGYATPGQRVVAMGGALVVDTASGPALWGAGEFDLLPSLAGRLRRERTGFWPSRTGARWAGITVDHGSGRHWSHQEPSSSVRGFAAGGANLFSVRFANTPTAAAFSPDDRWFVLAIPSGRDPETFQSTDPVIELRDADTGAVTLRRSCAVSAGWLAYLDADTLLALGGATLVVLDARTLALRQRIDLGGGITAIALSADGAHLALARAYRVEICSIAR